MNKMIFIFMLCVNDVFSVDKSVICQDFGYKIALAFFRQELTIFDELENKINVGSMDFLSNVDPYQKKLTDLIEKNITSLDKSIFSLIPPNEGEVYSKIYVIEKSISKHEYHMVQNKDFTKEYSWIKESELQYKKEYEMLQINKPNFLNELIEVIKEHSPIAESVLNEIKIMKEKYPF